MTLKNIIIFCILFPLSYSVQSQTSENLIRGAKSSQDIRFGKRIISKDRKTEENNTSVSKKKMNNSESNRTSFGVGKTPASLSVSQSGGAVYDVPITTPPGIKDINPNVGITFNSQASNGSAGYGWSISGLSTISRVSSTKFHDGQIDGVDFDQLDRFSLDGQRLVLKSGTYGAANSEYQTEGYSNLKIKAFGVSPYGSSYGPSYFIAYYPDGSSVWYGSASNSRSRMEWAVFKKIDAQNNTIQYNYLNDGELRIIDNIQFGHRSGTAPIEIKFYYKTRIRPEVAYVQDITFKRTKILDRVEVKGNSQLFRKYILTHSQTVLGYQRLESIQEFNKDNEGLTPINFSYDSSGTPIPTTHTSTVYPGYNYQTDNILTGEFNGDGKLDFILYNRNTRNQINIFNDTFNSYNNSTIGTSYNVPNFDEIISNNMLNHEGKLLDQQGIAFIKENINGTTASVDFKSYYSGTTGLYYHYIKTWNAPSRLLQENCNDTSVYKIPKKYVSGDFNGDGLTDVIAIDRPYSQRSCYPVNPGCQCYDSYVTTANTHFIDLNRNLASNFVYSSGALAQSWGSTDQLTTGDFNGDGKTDLFHFTEGKVFIYELNSSNQLSLIWTEIDSSIQMNKPVLLGDFNGDGKADFVFPIAHNNYNWRFFLSKGNTIYKYTKQLSFNYFESRYNVLHSFPGSNNFIYSNTEVFYSAMDVNGDNKSDIIRHAVVVSTSGNQSENVVRTYINKFGENDINPTFDEVQVYYAANSGISSFGKTILLKVGDSDKHEYAHLSGNHLVAHEFTGNHQKDVTLLEIENNGTISNINYHTLDSQAEDDFGNVYSGGYDQIYPFVNLNIASSLKLVGEIIETGGGITRTQKYQYSSAVTNASGLGFLGFKQIKKTNIYGSGVQTIWNITDYDPQKRGAPTQNWTSLNPYGSPSGFISKTSYEYQTQLLSNNVFVNMQSQVTSEDALTGVTTTTSYAYDQYFNPTSIVTSFPGGSETVSQEYYNNAVPYSNLYTIGRLTDKSTIKVLNGNSFNTQEKYYYNNNLVNQIQTKGNGTDWINKFFTHDLFGNVTSITKSASGMVDRIEQFQFDASGRYMTKSIDSEGLETLYTYDISSGNPLTVTSVYGLPISYEYDKWGRIVKETNYLGKETLFSYANSSLFGSGGLEKTINYDQGEDEKIYYNSLGWTMKETILSLSNKWICKSYEYDASGRKLKESEPYFSTGSPTQWNQYYFDEYGRSISQQLYTGKIINTTYNGLSATVNDGTKTVTSTKDAIGNIINIQDDGGSISYTYYPNGVMKSANYGTHSVNVTIDGWGRKLALSDPTAGNYTYDYNIFGEITLETTPNGETKYVYDDYGKLIEKSIEGDNTKIVSTYNYNSTSKLLTSINAVDIYGSKNYNYTYQYDTSFRLKEIAENTDVAKFSKKYTYDLYGRISNVTYDTFSLTSGTSSSVKTASVYDTSGILKQIKDFNLNTVLWSINSENARGDALNISLGNGIIKTKEYDQYGLLTHIYDRKLTIVPIGSPPVDPIVALKMDYSFDAQRGILNNRKNYGFTNWDESFTHDNLNRLTQISGAVNQSQTYDPEGRIQSNSFVGSYGYQTPNKYRLEVIDLNTAGETYYSQHQLQQIEYNAFKKPVSIIEEGHGRVNFLYGPMMNRTYAYYGGDSENINQRKYHKYYSSIIPVEIIENQTDASTKITTYVGGDAYTAPIAHIKTNGFNTGDVNDYFYLHRDYLGSILAISDSNAQILEERQFGAWGVVDNFRALNGATELSHDSLIDRGFTGHEHFFEVGLIHMNGRMYDPKLGRFLSPDNFIQDPYNTQSFNRYGYVWNNPLSYSDPSGEIFWVAVFVGAIVGAVSGAAAYIGYALQSGNWSWGGFALAVLSGAVIGGITGGISPSAVMVNSLWSVAAAGFIGSFMPTFTVPIGDWNISISASLAFGNSSGIGASLSVGYNDGNWSFSGGIGFMNYGNYHGFGNGTEIRYSILTAYDDGRTGFSLGTNWWRGNLGGNNDSFNQRTGVIGFRSGDFKVRYENDGGAGIKNLRLGDRGDSYRTASLQLAIGDFSAGFQLFTGKRDLAYERRTGMSDEKGHFKIDNKEGDFGRQYKRGFVHEVGTPYRLGALTLGYKGFRIGTNSEHVRHAIQDRFIHGAIKDGGFRNMSWNWNPFFQYTTPNTFTSW